MGLSINKIADFAFVGQDGALFFYFTHYDVITAELLNNITYSLPECKPIHYNKRGVLFG